MLDSAAALADFVTYVGKHLTGDEKGEAADFLDHLFRALGHEGVKQAGATRETRVAKKGGAKGKNFIDLLWPQRFLIEMKSRGKKLERSYDQVFDYWTHIVPHRPPYVILCNFDEFWIYDFNLQLFDPVEKIALADLPHRAEALAFLLPTPRKPLFNNNRVEVTRVAANDLAKLFRSLVARGEDRTCAQRFILQLLVTLVSEDMALLPRQILTRLIKECQEKGESAYDLIGGLFRQMNTATPARAGRFADVPYFNGGLFSIIDPIELLPDELEILATVADQKWDLMKPEIFGTLFQSSMDAGERHAFGAHFTSEFDIQKVVGPTIVRPWRARMAEAWDSMDDLMKVLNALRAFRVLDPACGSGNFLAVAYREMKRLEQDILNRLRELSKFIKVKGSKVGKSVPPEALMNAVSIQQFYGMDLLPFAAELAKVTLMVAKEMWVMENSHADDSESLFARETPLPLDNLDQNILCADALFTEWPQADSIIGNPPFISKNKMVPELGQGYVDKVRKRFPLVSGRADFCTYWFRLAHEHLENGARAGFVATNTIRQNYSREGSLDM
jgi:type II restriction/modification system DNA methylase subunit YeeA